MKKKYYHYTKRENIPDILTGKKLVKGGSFGIFVCDSFQDLCYFKNFYEYCGQFKNEDIAGIEFTTDAELEESFDHNTDVIPAKAFVSYEDEITIKIISVFDFIVN